MKDRLEKWDEKYFTIPKILEKILEDTMTWEYDNKTCKPWFRGQDTTKGPIPSIFRKEYDEFNMTTMFRNRAGALKDTPETNRLDKWLFLMQHYELPTRLLDWTESPLYALYFALESYVNNLKEKDKEEEKEEEELFPTIWVIHPYELNKLSGVDRFPNTWTRRDSYVDTNGIPVEKKVSYDTTRKLINNNSGIEHFRLAFHPKSKWDKTINKEIVEYPIAINSNYFDMRIFAQKSCFTIHGIDEKTFEVLLDKTGMMDKHFYKYELKGGDIAKKLFQELLDLGITRSNIYPDLKGLADELKIRFKVT